MKIRPTYQFLGTALIGIVVGVLFLALSIGADSRGNMAVKSPILGLFGFICFVVGACCLVVGVAKAASAPLKTLSAGQTKEAP